MKINRRNWLKSASIATATGAFLSPYVQESDFVNFLTPDSANGIVVLNSNENAIGPSDNVIKAINQSVKESNRYPWQTRQLLIDQISQLEGIPAENIILGSGSTEILQLAGLAFGANGGTIVSSYPTFPMMMQHAAGFQSKWIKVPLDTDFNHDLQSIAQAAKGSQLVYISNPNNPVGMMTPVADLMKFYHSIQSDTVVFVDEAYIEFTEPGLKASIANQVLSSTNLIVARTFSKIYGMAGLRVGYAYAHPDLIKRMQHYHIGFEINIPITSLHAAVAATADQNFVQHCKAENKKVRQMIYDAFESWKVSYVPSVANFVYFQTRRFAPDIVSPLEKQQVMILAYPDQPGYARVSIGTKEQIQRFLDCIELYLA